MATGSVKRMNFIPLATQQQEERSGCINFPAEYPLCWTTSLKGDTALAGEPLAVQIQWRSATLVILLVEAHVLSLQVSALFNPNLVGSFIPATAVHCGPWWLVVSGVDGGCSHETFR